MMKNNKVFRKGLWLLIFSLSIGLSAQVTRQPYLQIPTPNSMVVRWQTGTGVVGKFYYGTSVSLFTENIKESEDERIYHEVKISGLRSNEILLFSGRSYKRN
jgi:hypothetical protein